MPGPEEMKGKTLLRMELDAEEFELLEGHGLEIPGIHRVIVKQDEAEDHEHYLLVDSDSTKKVEMALKKEFGAELSSSSVPTEDGSNSMMPNSEMGERSTGSPVQLPSIFDIFTRIP